MNVLGTKRFKCTFQLYFAHLAWKDGWSLYLCGGQEEGGKNLKSILLLGK